MIKELLNRHLSLHCLLSRFICEYTATGDEDWNLKFVFLDQTQALRQEFVCVIHIEAKDTTRNAGRRA